MFSFLVGFGMLCSRKGLQGGYLLVQRREVLLDYEGQFVDFDRSVVEEGFPFGNYIAVSMRFCEPAVGAYVVPIFLICP